MQRGYMQGFEVFAREASELLVNRRSNEVVNIASTEMMKNWLAVELVFQALRHCERSDSDEAIQSCFVVLDCFASLAMTVFVSYAWPLAVLPSAACAAARRAIGTR
jgi:hypothetical protein